MHSFFASPSTPPSMLPLSFPLQLQLLHSTTHFTSSFTESHTMLVLSTCFIYLHICQHLSSSHSSLLLFRYLEYYSLYWCSFHFSLLIPLGPFIYSLLLSHLLTNLTLLNATQWPERPLSISFNLLTSSTPFNIFLFSNTRSIIFITSFK